MVVKKTTVHCWNLQHNLRKEALDGISTSLDGLLSSVHCAVDVKAQVSVRVAMNRKTRVCLAMPMTTYCTWECTYIHNFNSVSWLCMPPKQEKERVREVLKNPDFSIALPSSNEQLLPCFSPANDCCLLVSTDEICLVLCFCLLLCTKKKFNGGQAPP